MGGTCSAHEREEKFKVLAGKLEGKRPAGRPRHRWEDTIEMDLRQIGWGCMDRIHLAEDRDRRRTLGTR
jgi:hypothetical protein